MAEKNENLLLASLPQSERERLDPFLRRTQLELFEVLIEPNQPITHVVFPYDAVTSILQELPDGSSIETGLGGVEGIIGIPFWLGMDSTPTETLVQIAGWGHVMSTGDFKREVMGKTDSKLNLMIGRYVHAFLSMTSQVAACNRLHTLDQRLCRWLKLVHNRVRRDSFRMRQEFMAHMLGVQRPSVSIAANMLQKAGLIRYSRGQMSVLDPSGLEQGSCECLEMIEKQFDRVFDRPWRDIASLDNA